MQAVLNQRCNGSEVWCLRQNELVILKKNRAMVREICRTKLSGSKYFIDRLGLRETLEVLAEANDVK